MQGDVENVLSPISVDAVPCCFSGIDAVHALLRVPNRQHRHDKSQTNTQGGPRGKCGLHC